MSIRALVLRSRIEDSFLRWQSNQDFAREEKEKRAVEKFSADVEREMATCRAELSACDKDTLTTLYKYAWQKNVANDWDLSWSPTSYHRPPKEYRRSAWESAGDAMRDGHFIAAALTLCYATVVVGSIICRSIQATNGTLAIDRSWFVSAVATLTATTALVFIALHFALERLTRKRYIKYHAIELVAEELLAAQGVEPEY